MAVAAGLLGVWPSRREWAGLALGFAGITVYGAGGGADLPAGGLAVLLAAAVAFALGSVWRVHLALPTGLMGTAITMLAGGAALFAVALARGEAVVRPPGWLAIGLFVYLTVFSSFLGLVSYEYLLDHARPALAGSCAYVNPMVAMLLGTVIAGERVTADAWGALAAVAAGVALIAVPQPGGSSKFKPAGGEGADAHDPTGPAGRPGRDQPHS
jgi:drug/metabolite transporter (DMT)-like permease